MNRHDIDESWFTFVDESPVEVSSDEETAAFYKPKPTTNTQPRVEIPRLNLDAGTRKDKTQEKPNEVTNKKFENILKLNWLRNLEKLKRKSKINKRIRLFPQLALNERIAEMISATYDKMDQLVSSNRKGQDELLELMTMVKKDTADIRGECTEMAQRMANEMVKVGHSTIAIAEKSDKFKTKVLKLLHEQVTTRVNDLKDIQKQKDLLTKMVETGLDKAYEPYLKSTDEKGDHDDTNLKATNIPIANQSTKITGRLKVFEHKVFAELDKWYQRNK